MSRVVSIHEYELRPGVVPEHFQHAVAEYWAAGRPRLPGLMDRWLLRGLKGARAGDFAAVWIYRDRAAWESLWGPPDRPVPRSEYPAEWIAWEKFLAAYLAHDPDRIRFTAYELCGGPRAVAP